MARRGSSSRYLHYRRRKRHGNGKGMPRWLMALMVLGALMVITVAIIAGVSYGVYQSYASDLRPPDEVIAELPGGARIYDKNGALLYEYLPVDESGPTEEVKLSEISPYLIDATIAAEDASYWDNPGVNFRGLAAAAIDNLWPFGGSPGFLQGRGGSSITQQLVKNVYFLPAEREDRTIERKVKETVIALELTNEYSKEQILEWYLNLLSYGNLYTGVEAASQGYFGKPALDLTIGEAALLAGIPVNPSLYDPINNPVNSRSRQLHVLKRMHDERLIDGDEFWEAARQEIEVKPTRFPVKAPHFVFRVVEPELDRLFGREARFRDGLEVYTTLDLKWQGQAERILEEKISSYEATGSASGHNGAFVAIEPSTAQILVYVGSRDFFNDAILGKNDMAAAKNSPGSAFKPFTYLTAFIELGWGPGTWILDSPYTYRDASGSFTPENPDMTTRGQITIRKALGNSLNIPAVKTIVYAGVPEVIAQAKQMGITSLDDAGLGPALTVGGGDVRLIDMVYAFTVFPNLGVLKGVETELDLPAGNRILDPVSIMRVEDRDGTVLYPLVDGEPADSLPVLEERVAPAHETYLVTDILVDPNAECIIFGCGSLSIPDGRELAVKTGTSRPYDNTRETGDTWTLGYTPQIVAGTWFGNADNTAIGFATSTTLSWPIIREFMTVYHQDLPAERFAKPADLARAEVCLLSGLKPTPDCPLITPDDFFAKRALPEEDDDWWTKTVIDSRTGLLASDLTPPQFREDRFFLDLPDDLSAFEREQADEWAARMNAAIGPPPTEVTQPEDIPVAITSPADGAQIEQRVVIITGRASSSEFQSYRLEVNAGQQPGGWKRINASTTPVTNGTLGVWDARNAAPGRYTIRLTLIDGDLAQIVIEIRVRVVAAAQPTPTPLPPPVPTPNATPGDGGNNGQGNGPGHGPPQ